MNTYFLPLVLFANLAWGGCLTQHLQEGVSHNQARKIIYSQMTNGATEPISEILISYELNLIFLLKMTRFEQSFNILCESFESLPNPSAPELGFKNPILKNFKPVSVRALRKKLRTRNIKVFYSTVLTEIASLLSEPRLNCMTRHVLESIARVAALAIKDPTKEKEALRLLKLMPWALYGAKQLDAMASRHQARGVPILCADLPVIEYKL